MNSIGVAVVGDKSLYILLKELADYNFKYFDINEIDVSELKKENIFYVVIDDGDEIYKKIIPELRIAGFKIILTSYEADSEVLRDFLKKNLIDDYLKKENYSNLIEMIEKIENERYSVLILKNEYGEDTIINIEDIFCVSYDRNSRKSILETEDSIFYSRKNLSEVENIFSKYNIFIRIERGMIINVKKVYRINYDDGFIEFYKNKKIYYSRSKLKEIRDFIAYKINAGQL